MEQESLVQTLLQAGYSEEDLEREFSIVIGQYLSTEEPISPSWVETELTRMHPLQVRLSMTDWEFIAFCTTDSIRNSMVELFSRSPVDDAETEKSLTVEELRLREHALHEHAKELMLYLAQQKQKAANVEESCRREERHIEEWYAAV